MYRIMVFMCLLSSLVIAFTSWGACPSFTTFTILVVPQIAILGGCAGLNWMTRKSRLANFALLLPTLFVLLLTGKTVHYYCTAFTSAESAATYGLPIILFWSWMAQVVVVGITAGVLVVTQRNQIGNESKSVSLLAIGLIALPPFAFGLLMMAESVMRSMNR